MFPHSFGVRARYSSSGSASGEIVFLGLGLHAPDLDWDDYEGIDLKGKVAVLLDAELPQDHALRSQENRRLFYTRVTTIEDNGFLLAPLAKAAGGTEACGQAVFKTKNDPHYKAIVGVFGPITEMLKAKPRMDMPGGPAAWDGCSNRTASKDK